jgi:cytochrome c
MPFEREQRVGRSGRIQRAAAAVGAAAALSLAADVAPAQDSADEALRARIASASAENGRGAFDVCASCHSDRKDDEPLMGPGLWGIVGRPVASESGFDYSDALLAFGGTWTLERLEKLIENPNALVPGNTMGFYGVRDPQERIDILAYLLTLRDADDKDHEDSRGDDDGPDGPDARR